MALGSARLKEHQKLALVVYFLIHLFDIYNTQNQRQMSHQSPFSDGDNNNTMPRQASRSSNKQAPLVNKKETTNDYFWFWQFGTRLGF